MLSVIHLARVTGHLRGQLDLERTRRVSGHDLLQTDRIAPIPPILSRELRRNEDQVIEIETS
jgi:hypothetical protein